MYGQPGCTHGVHQPWLDLSWCGSMGLELAISLCVIFCGLSRPLQQLCGLGGAAGHCSSPPALPGEPKWGGCFLGPNFTCVFGLQGEHTPWAGEGVLLLGLDLAPKSCAGEKCSPSGRMGSSSGLPEKAPALWCRGAASPGCRLAGSMWMVGMRQGTRC